MEWSKGRVRVGIMTARALSLVLCFVVCTGLAASMTATLDRDTVMVGESATLTLTFEGASPDAIPSINLGQNVRVVSQGTAQQARFENGRLVSSLSLTYSLTPLQPGTYQIPPIQAAVRGQVLRSQQLKLTALKPDQARGAEQQPVFMRLFVPQKEAFIGQAIAVELQVFVQDGVLNAADILRAFDAYGATPITAEGCRVLRTAHTNRRRGQSGAATYTISTLVTAITPAKVGKLTIESIKVPLTIQLPIPGQRNRGVWDPFGMFQQSQARELVLMAPSETIEALALPSTGAPPGFGGAVGSFSLNVQAGPTNVAVGDPITVKVRIEGRGNLEGLTLPDQADWNDFKTYPATSQLESTDPLGLQGPKVFEQVVVPQTEQIKSLPEFSFSFFDPEKKTYQSLKSPGVPLTVRPGGSTPAPSVAMPRNKQQEEAPPAPDIVPIKRKLGSAQGPGVPLIRKPAFLVLQMLPIAALTAALIWRRRTDALAANPRLRRTREVDRMASSGLVELRRLAAENKSDEFFLLVFRLLQEQIGERLDVPASSITESVIDERLRPKGVPEDVLSELQRLFHRCDQARYAPLRSSEQLEAMIPEVESVIGKVRSLQV